MNGTAEMTEAPTLRRGVLPAPRRRRWGWSHTLVMLVTVLGVGLLMYPGAASWASAWQHQGEVSGYAQRVQSLPGEEEAALLNGARAYNQSLPAGPLRDPYAPGLAGDQAAVGNGVDAYFNALKVPGTDAMARVRVPAIGLDLPVYHGTSEATLSRGVGHLYGSSLPVGGTGTHAVLTGHSGFVHATLFDDLHQVGPGETIVVTVLDQDLYYRITQILTVLPDETTDLQRVAGKDLLTLVTCTPIGVNTHRLLVQAERVAAPAAGDGGPTIVTGSASGGFPWWAVVMVGVPGTVFLLIRPRRSKTPPARRQLIGGA